MQTGTHPVRLFEGLFDPVGTGNNPVVGCRINRVSALIFTDRLRTYCRYREKHRSFWDRLRLAYGYIETRNLDIYDVRTDGTE